LLYGIINLNHKKMARQKGVLNLEGKAGTLSFYQGRDGYVARQSNGMNGRRIFEDDAFIRTRENGAEFGRAGKAGKLLRTALRTLILGVADSRMTNRMIREMLKVVQSDPANRRGERTAAHGDAAILKGFEFNGSASLTQILFAPFEATIERAAGTGRIMLPPFNPQKMFSIPKGATHYCFLLGIASADFDDEKTVQAVSVSDAHELMDSETETLTLSISLPEQAGQLPVFLVFGVEFVQVVNGQRYGMNNANHNVLSIVEVDRLTD
jgi:hypothetical protein